MRAHRCARWGNAKEDYINRTVHRYAVSHSQSSGWDHMKPHITIYLLLILFFAAQVSAAGEIILNSTNTLIEDTQIFQSTPTTNYGSLNYMRVKSPASQYRIMLQITLTDYPFIYNNANSIFLYLYSAQTTIWNMEVDNYTCTPPTKWNESNMTYNYDLSVCGLGQEHSYMNITGVGWNKLNITNLSKATNHVFWLYGVPSVGTNDTYFNTSEAIYNAPYLNITTSTTATCTGSQIPLTGSWNITANTSCANGIIWLDDQLLINVNGTFNLTNISLIFQGTAASNVLNFTQRTNATFINMNISANNTWYQTHNGTVGWQWNCMNCSLFDSRFANYSINAANNSIYWSNVTLDRLVNTSILQRLYIYNSSNISVFRNISLITITNLPSGLYYQARPNNLFIDGQTSETKLFYNVIYLDNSTEFHVDRTTLSEYHIRNLQTDTINASVNYTLDGATVNCGNLQSIAYTSDTGAYSYTFSPVNISCVNNVVTLNLTGIEPATSSNVLTISVTAPVLSGTGGGGGGGGASYPRFKRISLLQLSRNTSNRFMAEAKVYNTNDQLADVDLAKVFIYKPRETEHQYTMLKLSTGHYLLNTELDLFPQQYKLDMVFFHNTPYDTISYSDYLNVQEDSALDVNTLPATLSDILKFLNSSNINLSSLFLNTTSDMLSNTSNATPETMPKPESKPDKNKLLIVLIGFFALATFSVALLDKKVRR